MSKVAFLSTAEAAKRIKDGASVGTVGFMLTGAPEEILLEIEKRFLETGKPKQIELIWASGVGDGGMTRGINHLCHEGLLKRTIGGHYGLIPKLAPLINEEKIEAYNFPQGVLTAMFRDMASHKPGVLTHVGLGTFVDPDFGGGRLNNAAKEALVEKLNIDGEAYLFYKAPKIDVAIIRGTEADEDGNIGIAKEALKLENLPVAMAAHNNGGIVIVQVERVVKRGTLDPKQVIVPGALVDIVTVVSDAKNHMQTSGTDFNIDFISNTGVFQEMPEASTLEIRKVIAKRAALQMQSHMKVLNFGIGVPEKVAEVLKEEGIENCFTATVEPGIYGGTAQGGLNFGSAVGPQAIIDHPYQFDFYEGGGIDITFLGMAECDASGSLNVSKFGPKIPGCGGFIDISQNAKEVVFCGTFTAGGLVTEFEDGKLKIVREGRVKKFLNQIEQITFNGAFESRKGKNIILVTERAVFEVRPEGLTLTEIAPGIDLTHDILEQMAFKPIVSSNLKMMDEAVFSNVGLSLEERFAK
jgi:propionate CoA-transferase